MSGHRNRSNDHCQASQPFSSRPAHQGHAFSSKVGFLCAGSYCRVLAALLLLALALLPLAPVSAQSEESDGPRLVLTGGHARQFPSVVLTMEAWDEHGNFLAGLQPSDIEVLEAGARLRPDRVEVSEVEVQFALALNISPALANHSQGASQYEHLRQALLRWSRMQEGHHTDFSFATPTGMFLFHSDQPEQWAEAFQEYHPDLAKLQPGLNSLAEALNMAAETGEGESRRQAVLFITPPLPASLESGLGELSKRAEDLGVKVFVWLVAPPASTPLALDHPIYQLAEATGGAFQQVYFPDSSLDIETLLTPLRNMYLLHYTSGLRQSGEYPTSVQAELDGITHFSNSHRLSIDVRPPNPIFLSPPALIERSLGPLDSEAVPSSLEPQEVNLQILVEFPDSHPREIRSTRLFVDDALVAVNTAPPYDQFIWPLNGAVESRQHLLRVEVVDELGLSGSSLELPVEVRVPALPVEKLPARIQGGISTRNLAVLASVLVSGGALVLVLLVKERRAKPARQPVRGSRVNGKGGRQPVAQVVARALNGLEHAGMLDISAVPARLVSLNENEQPVLGAAILVSGQEITLGSDPRRATQVLESPTVDGLHARIFRNASGCFYLADGNSVAGTWINYAPITAHGARLEHGDLVHIGRVMFRFELTDPARAKPPEVKVYGPDDPTFQTAGDPQ